MGEISKYRIVSGLNPEQVQEKVKELLKERYQPLGGLGLTASNGKPFYAQAMVQYKSAPANGG